MLAKYVNNNGLKQPAVRCATMGQMKRGLCGDVTRFLLSLLKDNRVLSNSSERALMCVQHELA